MDVLEGDSTGVRRPATRPRGLSVAILNPCYWPEVRRGSERMVRTLADGLLAAGHHPRLITSHPGSPSRTVEDGLPVARVRRPAEARFRRRMFEDYMTHVPFAYAELRRGNDDLAHSLFPTDALAAVRWSARTGRPAVFSYMGLPDREYLAARRRRVEITLAAATRSSAVTVLSQAAADGFWRSLGVEARVIHPAVDTRAFVPSGERAEVPTIFFPAAPDVVSKRFGLALGALELVRRQRPSARLMLETPRDQRLAAELRAAGHELVPVSSSSNELARTYTRAWATVLPSIGEAFGLVLIESLACGTPVIGMAGGAADEIVNGPDVGRLAEGDTHALAAAMLGSLELAEDAGTIANCRTRAGAFSIERCAAAFERLYAELLD